MAKKDSNIKQKKSTSKKKSAPTNKEKAVTPAKKSNNGLFFGAIITVLLIIVVAVVAVFCFKKQDPSDPKASLSYSTSFFIYDDGGYTLWDETGKQLTGDTYKSRSSFVGGYAYVKKDDQAGVINEKGAESIPFGKYSEVQSKGGLYVARGSDSEEELLLTGTGKELERGEEIDVTTNSSTCAFVAINLGDKIKVYTYDGTLVAAVDVVGDADGIELDDQKDYGAFYYNDKNIFFDVRDGKVLASFEGPRYSIDEVSKDRKMILLDSSVAGNYKLLTDGKVYDLDETKYYSLTLLGHVIGYDNYDSVALLDNNYKVAKKVSIYLELKDTNNYATVDDNKAVIYHNGDLAKTFDDDSSLASSGVLYEDLYAITDGEKARFYHLDGSQAFDKEFLEVDTLFDKNHHAIVSDEEDVYYLIDTKGNRVENTTGKKISPRDGGYEVEDDKGDYAIADKSGKLITDFKYDDLYYRSSVIDRNIWTGHYDNGEYDVIDVDSNKVLLEKVNVQTFNDNYFTIKNSDKKTEYYTYEGKQFYVSES